MVHDFDPPDPDARADAAWAAIVARMKRLPSEADPRRSWAAIERTIARERRAQPLPYWLQTLALAAAALLIAALLCGRSHALAEWVAANGFVASLSHRLAALPNWRACFAPGLFLAFGGMAALAALPLVARRRDSLALPRFFAPALQVRQ